MPHDLKADHEIEELYFTTHFYETIDSIGGIYGICLITFGIFLFYLYTHSNTICMMFMLTYTYK